MKAITQSGNTLVWQDVPNLSPREGEVLLRVRAAGVNRADLSQRAGSYPPPLGAPETLGLEVAGVVAELGPGVSGVGIGDEVCALLAGGGYAEYAPVPAELLMPVPQGWTVAQAAGLPEVFLTAHLNLFEIAALGIRRGGADSRWCERGRDGSHSAGGRRRGAGFFATAGTDEKVAGLYRAGRYGL